MTGAPELVVKAGVVEGLDRVPVRGVGDVGNLDESVGDRPHEVAGGELAVAVPEGDFTSVVDTVTSVPETTPVNGSIVRPSGSDPDQVYGLTPPVADSDMLTVVPTGSLRSGGG